MAWLMPGTSFHDAALKTAPIKKHLPELVQMLDLADDLHRFGDIVVEGSIPMGDVKFPILSFQFGSKEPTAPTFALIGGVHGLERIGTRIVIEYLKTFQELLYWDALQQELLSKTRILFYPLVNPGGMYRGTRANPRGVDLMRNAPIDAAGIPPWFIMAGHRLSPHLPWYRGSGDEPLEAEAQMLQNFTKRHIFPSRFAITLDVHSGFGARDRLWFPYASSKDLFENYVEVYALKRKLDQALPNHIYQMEPQSHAYRSHGDLWDYFYRDFLASNPAQDRIFLPLSLELGSWNWIRKNPLQAFSSWGIFNPMKPHRTRRILRRHISLIDFLMRAVHSYKAWVSPPATKRETYRNKADVLWRITG